MKSSYNGKPIPADGKAIDYVNGALRVPDRPILPFIEGDGTGRDIWKASERVFDAAVQSAYGSKRKVAWFEVFAGQKAYNTFKEWLPNDTVDAIRDFRVAMTAAVGVVAVELAAISYIRHRYMDTPFLSAALQVVVGGVLVFLTGILIGSS